MRLKPAFSAKKVTYFKVKQYAKEVRRPVAHIIEEAVLKYMDENKIKTETQKV